MHLVVSANIMNACREICKYQPIPIELATEQGANCFTHTAVIRKTENSYSLKFCIANLSLHRTERAPIHFFLSFIPQLNFYFETITYSTKLQN